MLPRRRLARSFEILSFLAVVAKAGVAEAAPPTSNPTPIAPPAGGAANDGELPPPPAVSDPMLAPLPLPAKAISSWSEASALLHARSVDLRIAEDDVLRAEAQSRSALGAMLPQLNATGQATHHFITNESSQVVGLSGGAPVFRSVQVPFPEFATGSLVLQQNLLTMRPIYAIGTAKRNVQASKLTLEEQKRQLALAVAKALVAVVTAERVSELNRSGLRNALERLDLTKKRQALGAANGLDLVRSEQDATTARQTLLTGDESLRQAREALGLALGFSEAVGVTQGATLDGWDKTISAMCKPADNLEARSDLMAAKKRLEVAERAVTDAKYAFVPTITAQSAISTTTVDTGAAPNTTWNIQGVLTIPIWDGGMRYGALRDTNAQVDQAEMKVVQIRRQAELALTQAKRQVTVAEGQRDVANDTRKLAVETDRLTRRSYQEGRGTSLELVTAAQALRDAEINLATREFTVVQARLQLTLQLANCDY